MENPFDKRFVNRNVFTIFSWPYFMADLRHIGDAVTNYSCKWIYTTDGINNYCF